MCHHCCMHRSWREERQPLLPALDVHAHTVFKAQKAYEVSGSSPSSLAGSVAAKEAASAANARMEEANEAAST